MLLLLLLACPPAHSSTAATTPNPSPNPSAVQRTAAVRAKLSALKASKRQRLPPAAATGASPLAAAAVRASPSSSSSSSSPLARAVDDGCIVPAGGGGGNRGAAVKILANDMVNTRDVFVDLWHSSDDSPSLLPSVFDYEGTGLYGYVCDDESSLIIGDDGATWRWCLYLEGCELECDFGAALAKSYVLYTPPPGSPAGSVHSFVYTVSLICFAW